MNKKIILHIKINDYSHIFQTGVITETGLIITGTFDSLIKLWLDNSDYEDADIINLKQ